MKREILFRGKRVDNGEWVEGNRLGNEVIVPRNQTFYISPKYYLMTPAMKAFCVDPATVGQYTGLKDKDGKRIFDGDLLDGFEYPFYREEDKAHNYFAEVVWFDDSSAFGLYTRKYPASKVRGISEGNACYMDDFEPNDWQVIGNIHDNPELLEGGEG